MKRANDEELRRSQDDEISRRVIHRTPAMNRLLGDEQRKAGRMTPSKNALLSLSHTQSTPSHIPRLIRLLLRPIFTSAVPNARSLNSSHILSFKLPQTGRWVDGSGGG